MNAAALLLLSAAVSADPMAEEFDFQFRAGLDSQAALKLNGPAAKQVAKTDAQGLRIALPPKRPDRSAVGVQPAFRVRGDFEVILSYEVLNVENPPASGAGVSLWLKFDNATQSAVSVTRLRKAAKEGARKEDGKDAPAAEETFGANLITPGPDGKDKYQTRTIPAAQKRGRLRLTRTGGTVNFFAADGPSGPFLQIHTAEVGTADVRTLRAQCVAGGSPDAVDVRLIALHIGAERLTNEAITDTGGIKPWVKYLWGGVIVAVLAGVAFGFYWLTRPKREVAA